MATHLVAFLLLVLLVKPKTLLLRNVLQINMHRLTETEFQDFQPTTFKMAATTSFHAKCCHLVSEHKACARRLYSVFCQFLIYYTFALLVVAAGVFLEARCTSYQSTNSVKALKDK